MFRRQAPTRAFVFFSIIYFYGLIFLFYFFFANGRGKRDVKNDGLQYTHVASVIKRREFLLLRLSH